MTRIKLAVFAGSALLAGPAFADDQTEPAAGGEATAAPAGGAGTGMEATGTATGEAPTWWSRSAIDRPYIVNKGKVGAYLDYGIAKATFTNPLDPTMSASFTGDGFRLGGAYGITDKISAGLQYGFTPGLIGDADSEIKGDLGLFGMYQIVNDGKLNITATADFSLDLCGGTDAMGDCVTAKGLHAGLGARYTLAPKMAVFTGSPYGPGPVGQHLSISLESSGPITFNVPVGFMYQATPELNVHATTALANLAISNAGDSAFIFADYIPFELGGLYSVTPNIDVTASFNLPDLKEAGFDLYAFFLGARYYN